MLPEFTKPFFWDVGFAALFATALPPGRREILEGVITVVFADRAHAGSMLAEKLQEKIEKPAVLLAVPRGGVIVAQAIARRHDLPLDLVIPRKIGAPLHPEVAIGAVAQDGSTYLNHSLIQRASIEKCYIN
ncbi:MAG: hypothetical protein ACOY81_02760 [Bacillota bacterium]